MRLFAPPFARAGAGEAMTPRLAVLAHEPETGLGAFAEQLDVAGV